MVCAVRDGVERAPAQRLYEVSRAAAAGLEGCAFKKADRLKDRLWIDSRINSRIG